MNVIEVTNLIKRYGERTAVDGVSFSVDEGEIFAILGPNGAGKTTRRLTESPGRFASGVSRVRIHAIIV